MSDLDLTPQGFERGRPPDWALTPFLDLDPIRFERNIAAMQRRADAAGVLLRPHIKTHKSLRLARKQIAVGAVGVTASKPSEALIFVEGGISSVTLAYPVICSARIDALLEAARARDADIRFLVDHHLGLAALADAGLRHGRQLPVFIKVDVGLGRAGVAPDSPQGVELAVAINQCPGVRLAGLLSHAGHAYGAGDRKEIDRIARAEAVDLLSLKARIEAAGIKVPCLSVGSTPTCLGTPIPAGIDEIRPGNYAVLDRTALRLGLCASDDLALSVVATVVSRNSRYAIIDAGSKALSSDGGPHGTVSKGFGLAVSADIAPGRFWEVEKLSEEHGFVLCGAEDLAVGSRIRIFPNHACATIACFDAYGPKPGEPSSLVDARGRFI
jgi:D-serine deaminase-like pyridoxal phosphate-dependent protein